jgi:hypothetical protein
MRNGHAILAAVTCALVAAAAHAAPITPAAFTGAQVVENFEGVVAGPNVATSAYANILLPGSVSAYSFASGVTLAGPNPGLFANGAFLHNAGVAGASNNWGANGSVGSAAQVPDPWGLPSSTYLGAFDNLAVGSVMLDLYFATDMHRVGAWVAGMAGTTITIETYDATNTLLETLTIAAPSVAAWGSSFLGLERSEGIRRVAFRGSDFGIDGLTFDATPLPEPRVGLLILAALAIGFWRGREPAVRSRR